MKKGKEVKDRERAKNKGGRGGGGKKFSIENEDELAIRNKMHSEQRENRQRQRAEDGDDSEDEFSEEDKPKKTTADGTIPKTDNVFSFASKSSNAAAATEEEEEGAGFVNPNHQLGGDAPMNRREREAAAAEKAKEDYMRRHLAGETEQARADMERLALVRKRREEQARQREAEGRPPGWSADGIDSDADEETLLRRPQRAAAPPAPAPAPISESAAKKKAAAAAPAEEVVEVAADGGPPKLKPMDIKQMNGDALKEHLKARGLPIQGQKKDLMKRLSDYEAGRP